MSLADRDTRTLHVEPCMGTVFTIDIRDPGDWSEAIGAAVAWLHHVDAVFSTYRPDSDLSRIRRGELRVGDADPLVADVLDLCAAAQRETGGYFTALPGGRIDPTGLVKGWAVDQASQLLAAAGSMNHAVNGGGDIQTAGEAAPGRGWTVGVTDPHDRSRLLASVSGRGIAVATSGSAERGAHIIDPFTGRPATGMAAVTVVASRLTGADLWATAGFVMGPSALGHLEAIEGYEALLVTADGAASRTSGWSRLAA